MPSALARLVLWPAEVAYGGGMRLRERLYRRGILRSRRLEGTVISVGNLTVGGTGKTPMVLWLAERLAAEGHRPAVLTRGYRGESGGSGAGVSDADEVALLRERLGERATIAVGKDRCSTGMKLAASGVRWFILDDGFQHLALKRDADIVLLDATAPFGGDHVLPAGRLREPRQGLSRADVVVITRAEHDAVIEATVRSVTRAPIFYAWPELERVAGALAGLPELDRRATPVFAFCGIGNPAAFFEDLRRWGFRVAGTRSFRDHHRYSAGDLAAIERAAAEAGAAALICTEKDRFNLRGAGEPRLPLYAGRIRLQVSDGDAFWNAIGEAIRRNRAGNAA